MDISLEDRENCAHTQTINTRLQLLQVNWLMSTNISSAKAHKFERNNSDICSKCGMGNATLLHCMWECCEIRILERDSTVHSKHDGHYYTLST